MNQTAYLLPAMWIPRVLDEIQSISWSTVEKMLTDEFQHEFQAMIEQPALRICMSHRSGAKVGAMQRKSCEKRNVGFEPKRGLSDLNKMRATCLRSKGGKPLGSRPPSAL
jgi:hypothetical protein